MKGDKKMIVSCCVMAVIGVLLGVLLIALSILLASTNCGCRGRLSPTETEKWQSGTPVPTEGTTLSPADGGSSPEGGALEKPAPGEITRIKLVEGLTLRDVDMVRPEGIEYILGMLNVDTYEPVDPEHERAVAVLDEASVVLEFYAGDFLNELYGAAWVTDGCEVVVIIEGGGVWYTRTASVDTVLITAEFGRKP